MGWLTPLTNGRGGTTGEFIFGVDMGTGEPTENEAVITIYGLSDDLFRRFLRYSYRRVVAEVSAPSCWTTGR